jgi:hypothetical protein
MGVEAWPLPLPVNRRLRKNQKEQKAVFWPYLHIRLSRNRLLFYRLKILTLTTNEL